MQLRFEKVKYTYFDFHNECRKMRWERLSILIKQLEDDLIRDRLVFGSLSLVPSYSDE